MYIHYLSAHAGIGNAALRDMRKGRRKNNQRLFFYIPFIYGISRPAILQILFLFAYTTLSLAVPPDPADYRDR